MKNLESNSPTVFYPSQLLLRIPKIRLKAQDPGSGSRFTIILPFLLAAAASSGGGGGLLWGLCLPDCPYIPPEVSCLAPPPVPTFGKRNSSGYVEWQNYQSSWFTLAFHNDSSHLVSRAQRNILYQPWIPYDSSKLTEGPLSFHAKDHLAHFNDVYEIRTNATVESYTCPLGWVFEHSNNMTHSAICLDWEWRVDFNISSPCVRK